MSGEVTVARSGSDPFGLVGNRLDGKYAVEALVAEGGFGVVYRCSHAELQKTVALKVLKIPSHHGPEAREEFFRKFSNEARTIARIDHEAIVRVLDFGTSSMPSGDRAPWMALEWLEGHTLQRDLDERAAAGLAARSPSECLALLQPVLEAVGLAHEEGIAHRDIKPGNLMMVTSRRGEVRLKLLDFGVAKVMTDDDRASTLGQTSTQAHLQMFSLEYAAPEQISGTRTGPWTDVHALSLVLTEMLTGEEPYEGEDPVEIFSEALSRERPTPARWGLDVGSWEAVLQRALALRPADRFPDAGALLRALLAEVPAQAVWREEVPPPTATPAAPPPTSAPPPPVAVSAAPAAVDSPAERITELLPQPPAPLDDDQEPVRLPVHGLGRAGWGAALAGLLCVVGAVVFTQWPSARPPRRPVVAAPTAAPAAAAAQAPAPSTPVAPPVAAPAAVAAATAPAPAPSPVVAPPTAEPAVAAARPAPPRPIVRRSRPARESGGRIPIE